MKKVKKRKYGRCGVSSPTHPSQLSAAIKASQAIELRIGGASFEQIAKTLGYGNRGSAHRAVERALAKTIQEPAEKLLRLVRERFNRLWLVYWPKAMAGDLKAAEFIKSLMERQAKYESLDHMDLYQKYKALEEKLLGEQPFEGHGQVSPAQASCS